MPIYLDYAATTPLDPAVGAALAPWLGEHFGNPASPHRWGYDAAAAVAVARGQVAALLGVAAETVAFTGGATEAVNWALKGVMLAAPAPRRRLVTLATEHSCVLESARWLEAVGCGLTVLPVQADGTLDLAALNAALGPDVALVSAMLVNNETGVIHPVAEIAARAHAAGALMHCDAAQGFGKVACDALGADLVSVSGHKIYGPKGVGALYRRPGVDLVPLLHGGGQEDGRSGTLSPALCVGLGAAAAVAASRMADDAAHIALLSARLRRGLGVPFRVNGDGAAGWPGIVSLTFEVDATRLLAACRELAFSTGSACATGRPSHVLAAMDVGDGVRLSFGRFTTADEIDTAAVVLTTTVRQLTAQAA